MKDDLADVLGVLAEEAVNLSHTITRYVGSVHMHSTLTANQ